MLPAALVERLDPLIRRLATDHDGERLAVVAAIDRVLAAGGCGFHDLADHLAGSAAIVFEPGRPATRAPSPVVNTGLLAVVTALVGHPSLNPWEQNFLVSIRLTLLVGGGLTEKQAVTLERLRLKAEAAAA